MVAPAIWLFLLFAATDAPQPIASVAAVEKIECLAHSMGIKATLNAEVKNNSTEPLTLGRVSVANERFYRFDSDGKTIVIGTSSTPDEFPTTDPFDTPEHVPEETLAPGAYKRYAFDHIIYVMPHVVLRRATEQWILVSFHVTNVENNGHVSEYWTAPISIFIPTECRLP